MRAVGLDLSLSSSGIALVDGHTRRVATRVPTNATDTQRSARLLEIVTRLSPMLTYLDPQIAVVEDMAGHFPGKVGARLAELHGAVMVRLAELDVPVVRVPATVLKKYHTGHGGADKAAMIARAQELGAVTSNDDEADAFLLRQLAVDMTAQLERGFVEAAAPRELAKYRLDVLLGIEREWGIR